MSSIQNKMLHFLLQKKLQICLEWNQFCLASSETDKCPLYIKKKKRKIYIYIYIYKIYIYRYIFQCLKDIILKGKEWGTEDSMVRTSRIIGTKQETG